MKKAALLLASLCAFSIFASPRHSFTPITAFNEGMYLGLGRYTADDGSSDYYASFASFYPNDWELVYLINGETRAYNLHFDINEHGFLQVEATVHGAANGKGADQNIYQGHGWCGSHQCQYFINIGENRLMENVTFHPSNGKIYRFGNVHLKSDDGHVSVIVWDEEMTRIDTQR